MTRPTPPGFSGAPGARAISDNGRIIAANMKRLRLAAGLTLQEVAVMLGVSYQQVQKYESGLNRLPVQYMPVLCDVLGVPAEMLLDGTFPGASRHGDLDHLRASFMRIESMAMRRKVLQVVEILGA